MKKIPQISEAEWIIMKVIWSKSPISAKEVVEELDDTITWQPKTIKTLLNRLLKKEVLDFKKDGRAYLYYPLLTEKDCMKAENKSFLKRVYDGVVNTMFVNFLEDYDLSEKEINELQKILEQQKNK